MANKSKKKTSTKPEAVKEEVKVETAEEKAEEAQTEKVKASKKSDSDAKGKKAAAKGKKANPAVKYFRDLRSEFKKVVWPAKQTVITNTGVVVASMIVTGAGVFVMDLVFAKLFQALMGLVGG